MILTCPQCSTQFELDESILLPEGKKVKCTKCSHVWFQRPDGWGQAKEDAAESDDLSSFDEIDSQIDALLAQQDDAEDPQENTEDIKGLEESPDHYVVETDEVADPLNIPSSLLTTAHSSGEEEDTSGIIDKLDAYMCVKVTGIALLSFLIVSFAILVVFKSSILNNFPALRGFYHAFGYAAPVEGKDIVFNNLKAEIDADTHKVTISGDIVNLSEEENKALPMMAYQLDKDKNILKSWAITPPVSTVEAGGIVKFASDYKAVEGADYIKIGFTLMPIESKSSEHPVKEQEGKSGKKADKESAVKHPTSQEHAPAPSDHQKSHVH